MGLCFWTGIDDNYNEKAQFLKKRNWVFCLLSGNIRLATDTEFLLCDDRAVTVDVFADQIVEKAATLTYESLQCACGSIVFVVALEVLGEVLDTDREECDLAFGAACIVLALAVLLEDSLLFFS